MHARHLLISMLMYERLGTGPLLFLEAFLSLRVLTTWSRDRRHMQAAVTLVYRRIID